VAVVVVAAQDLQVTDAVWVFKRQRVGSASCRGRRWQHSYERCLLSVSWLRDRDIWDNRVRLRGLGSAWCICAKICRAAREADVVLTIVEEGWGEKRRDGSRPTRLDSLGRGHARGHKDAFLFIKLGVSAPTRFVCV
jgi:hypothetical protein